MKLKTTKKSVKNEFNNIYSIGYCNAQYLLQGTKPFAYSTGTYGWSCDYYNIDGVCISTGYSPIGESIGYDLVREYDNKAMKIFDNYDLDYQVREKRVNKLLVKFINEINNLNK